MSERLTLEKVAINTYSCDGCYLLGDDGCVIDNDNPDNINACKNDFLNCGALNRNGKQYIFKRLEQQ